jgi:hypothetical protein
MPATLVSNISFPEMIKTSALFSPTFFGINSYCETHYFIKKTREKSPCDTDFG